MRTFNQFTTISLTIFIVFGSFFLQAEQWPNDDAGDPAAEKAGYMEGNNVRLLFRNTTELSDWITDPALFAHCWPNDDRRTKLTDGIAFMVGARVYVENGSVPVTDPQEIQTRTDLDTITFCQTSYREEQDTDPTGQVEWNFYPPRGYANDDLYDAPPAMSSRPETWPAAGWPTAGDQKQWAGQWFGRQGPGIYNADEECYFVVNDAQDQEYLTEESDVKYYPRPGHYIGELDPRMSVQVGNPWGGAGLRVAVRGYQWDDFLVKDIIFWEYAIGNISDYDIPETAVGFWVDSGIGNDGGDDLASTDAINMVYMWDVNGIGDAGQTVGSVGYILLETPAHPNDAVDNDQDGLVDEQREDVAAQIVGPTDGIADLQQYHKYYGTNESKLRSHWDADEDQDWRDGNDKNHNGRYDADEFSGDDVGLDGKGPTDLNYVGPDLDGSECNHRPDYQPGVGCEPNFAALDVNESDMLGLTSFHLFPVPDHTPPYRYWFRNDESMWELLGVPEIIPYESPVSNLALTFASGPFRLNRDDVARVSIAEVHSFDPVEGFSQNPEITPVSAPDLHFQKMIAQSIVEADYNLILPNPDSPAFPNMEIQQDGRSVVINWDDNAELNTVEHLLDDRNDFEGYKLYKQFSLGDQEENWSEMQLLLQCDKIDGIKGNFEYGTPYYLGDDTGLLHRYVDDNICDGEHYRYTLAAYDFGITPNDSVSAGSANVFFPPCESADYELIAIPFPAPIDFPWKKVEEHFIGSGTVLPEIVNYKEIASRHTYVVKFHNDTLKSVRNTTIGFWYVANGLEVLDVTDGSKRLVYQDFGNQAGSIVNDYTFTLGYSAIPQGKDLFTGSFEGIRLKVNADVVEAEYDSVGSRWLQGGKPITIIPTLVDSKLFSWDHEIVFTDNEHAFVSGLQIKPSTRIKDENDVRLTNDVLLGEQSFSFYVRNITFGDSLNGESVRLEMVGQDMDGDGQFNMLADRVLVGYLTTSGIWAGTTLIIDFPALTEGDLPQAGDKFQVKFKRPFFVNDSLVFIVDPEGTFVNNLGELPMRTELKANYPNPFNPVTTISYSISKPEHVVIQVFNIIGQSVATLVNSPQEPGNYKITFRGGQFPSGVYFYTLDAGAIFEKRKMVLVR